jgi:hypothetical protein
MCCVVSFHRAQLTAHGSHLELPPATLNIMGQLHEGLGWGIECLSIARSNRFADEATGNRWMQHAGAVIKTSGGLANMQFSGFQIGFELALTQLGIALLEAH